MATAPKIEDMSAGFSNVMSEMQSRAKAAYEKSTEMAGESTEFAKGNVEAMVEAGKIWMTGLQDMARSNAEDAKTAFEAATSDMKEMAAAKSPTDLFQLQGELMRRNADKAMEMGSRNAELTMKLVNDAFAPIGSRVSVAQEKFSKVA
jgi:phasin family protein